jgi:hypothetical protein
LYHIVAYLVSLDKLFDDQAKLGANQSSRASGSHSKDAPSPSGSS